MGKNGRLSEVGGEVEEEEEVKGYLGEGRGEVEGEGG